MVASLIESISAEQRHQISFVRSDSVKPSYARLAVDEGLGRLKEARLYCCCSSALQPVAATCFKVNTDDTESDMGVRNSWK
jgi:hypothetical protein